jgi:hypothetical protein
MIYRIITRATSLAAAVVLVVAVLLYMEVKVYQPNDISKNNNQISQSTSTLNSTPSLNQILKINDAIQVLPTLYNSKPDITRLSGYLSSITPSTVSINNLDLDFSTYGLTMSGTADSIDTINTFIDTLKFCQYTTATDSTGQLAFSKVVLSSYAYAPDSTTGQNFSVTAQFAPQIFDTSVSNVQLVVPNKITTRSDLDQPTALFNTVQSNGK